MRIKKYVAYCHKNPHQLEALNLSLAEKAHRSEAFIFSGMRQPSLVEADAFLLENCGHTLGKKHVFHVEEYACNTSPNPGIMHDGDAKGVPSYAVFAWEERLLPERQKSGYTVQLATGWTEANYGCGTNFEHMLFSAAERFEPNDIAHDLALELQCDPRDMDNNAFKWDKETLSLPQDVVSGIWKAAAAETLRNLGRHLNDLYLTESPADTDEEDVRKVKRIVCKGLSLAMEALDQKLKTLASE